MSTARNCNPDPTDTDVPGLTSEATVDDDLLLDPVRRRRTTPVIAAVALVVVAGLVWIAATVGPAENADVRSPLLGRPAPTAAGETVQGGAFDLTGTRGRWVVVNFFATWCVPCQIEHPELERFHVAHTAIGDASVVSVIFNDKPDLVRRFLADHGGSWPMVIDKGGRVALDFGIGKVPESYLVDPAGIVVAKLVGGVKADNLDELLQRAKTDRPRT